VNQPLVSLLQSVENRVSKLEFRVDGHQDELAELKGTTKSLQSSLRTIENSLLQIKWLVIGGGIVWTAGELGLTKALKLLMG
jgi:hypothetical protein